MAILAECPSCHRRQKIRHKKCVKCGDDLDKQKQIGKLKYWIVYRLDGKRVWEPALNENGENLGINDAKAAAGKREGQRKERAITILNVKPVEITFNELAEWYLKQDHVKDRENKERNLKDFNKYFGNWNVTQPTNSDLLNYRVRLKKEGLADATIDGKISSVKTMINQGVKDKKIPREAAETFATIKKLVTRDPSTGKPSNAKEAVYTYEEVNAIHDVMNERSQLPWRILSWGGMREGEVLNLKPSRIDLKEKAIKLRPEDTKERKAKTIPIIEDYEEIECLCKEAKDPEQSLFTVTKDRFIRDVRKAHNDVGKPYGRKSKDTPTAHSLRHTFDTNAMRANVPQAIGMKILGHSTPEMNLRYSHPHLEDLRATMERVNELAKTGEASHDSPTLSEILKEVKGISKFVDKLLTKSVSEKKEESEYVS